MNEDKPIDYETEYHKTYDNLMILYDKYKDLEEDWRYYQNLAGKYFEESIKLKKQNKQLKEENEELKKELDSFKPIIFESEKGTITLYEKSDLND